MYLVMDIETVPDLTVWTPPAQKPEPPPRIKPEKTKIGKADQAFIDIVIKNVSEKMPIHPLDVTKALTIAELMENGHDLVASLQAMVVPEAEAPVFPPVYAHRPIAIGFMQIDDNWNVKAFGCAGTLTHGDDEKRLLTDFGTFAGSHGHTLVGWNSKAFDFPVIMTRSMHHMIPAPWYGQKQRFRYDEDRHIDLKQAITEYGGVSGARGDYSLDTVSKVIGLPGKVGTDGSMVNEMYAQGKHQEISQYCLCDVAETAFIFLRFMVLRGRMDVQSYGQAARGMLAACESVALPIVPMINRKLLLGA